MDDLLDLSWSASPAPAPAPAQGTSGSKPASTTSNGASSTPARTGSGMGMGMGMSGSAFDLLAKPAGASGPNYALSNSSTRTSSPLPRAAPGGLTPTPASRVGSATASPQPRSPAPAPASAASNGADAFSSLLGLGAAAPSNSSKNMTMAERSAQLAAEKKAKEEAEKSRWDHGDFWDRQMGVGSSSSGSPGAATATAAAAGRAALGTLDTLHAPVAKPPAPASAIPAATRASPAPSLSPAPASAQPANSSAGSFWDTPGLQPSLQPARASPSPLAAKNTGASASTSQGKSTSTSTANTSYDAFDDLDGFLQPATSSKPGSNRAASPAAPAPAPAPADPWDLDALSAAVPSTTAAADHYDGEDDDDDLLGLLGRPAKPKTPVSQTPRRGTPPSDHGRASGSGPASPERRAPAPARVDSPPPHIVGQIVEMGFAPAQARAALAATASGVDVQEALESLLASRGATPRGPEHDLGGGGRDELEMDDERIAREMQAREDRRSDERRQRHAARRAGPSRDSVRTDRDRDSEATDDFTKQADQLMAHASEIGASMLSKATSFWNTGKERALKVYEEQKRALDAQNAAAAAKKRPTDGRPRWMVEAEEAEAAAAGSGARQREGNGHSGRRDPGGFRDDTEGFRDEDMPPSPRQPKAKPKAPPQPQPRARQSTPASADTWSRADSLFADDEPPRPAYVSKNRHLKKPTPAASPAAAASPRRVATPVALITRQLVPASPSQVAAAAQHKAKGNDHFKLGRYAEADAAYTAAISSLPAGHILLVTLHNNRAATRLKLGESGGAAADCTAAIELVGPGYHPSKEVPLPADVDVKLGDALVKATVKRAQAHEMSEKWKLALEDWERVLGFDTALSATCAASKTQASEGVRRARRALEGADKPAGAGAGPAPAAKPPTSARTTPRPSAPVDVSKSAAVSGMRAAAAAAEKEEVERLALKDSVDARIEAWKAGKETNLRALIASLDSVLWDDILAGGLKVGMHQLVTEKQVKIKYMKVVARLHPDKLSTATTTVEQRMLASATFGVLSEAWAAFNA